MPEGDTLLRAAHLLAPALEGKLVRALHAPRLASMARALVGRRVERVEARGKNLLVHLEGGRAIRTHLGMHGRWALYAPGARWGGPRHLARVVLEVDGAVAVCFLAARVELVASVPAPATSSNPLAALGPDVLRDDFDEAEALRRLRARGDREIGDAILDQRAIAGVGNIYKSESLFLAGVDPFARVDALDDVTLRALLRRVRGLMRANVDAPLRTTTLAGARERHFVYDRSGRPCLRCGTRVRMRRQGAMKRSTYFCPRCQRVTAAAGR